MRILLLNDNPVVRKLVALSAQKTKDDLNVIWSVDEIEHTQYDLLIVDDAHYSDEVMSELKAKITYKSSLLMATRGAAVPAGFDKVINKPFLPTDLVELFIGIEKALPSATEIKVETKAAPVEEKESGAVIDLDSLLDLDEDLMDDELDNLLEEVPLKTNVLDHEEVQELQDLLDDTDDADSEFTFDDSSFSSPENETADTLMTEDLDDDFLTSLDEPKEDDLDDLLGDMDFGTLDEETSALEEDDFLTSLDELKDDTHEDDLADLMGEMDLNELDEEASVLDEDDFDALMAETSDDILDTAAEADGTLAEEMFSDSESIDDDFDALLEESGLDESLETSLSDDELDDLDQQIQEAVEDLSAEDLEETLDTIDFGDLDLEALAGDLSLEEEDELDTDLEDEFSLDEGLVDKIDASLEMSVGLDGLDELDAIDERDIKLAIGEEVEEELEIRVGSGGHSSLDAEALSEAMGSLPAVKFEDELESLPGESKTTSIDGVDALQTLLKALSNEDVAKALKGLSINININFGNDK